MPQLDQFMHVYASQLFWLGIVLAILYFGVGHLMLPKIEGTMDDRNARIAADIAAAQAAQTAAVSSEEKWRADAAHAHASAQAIIAGAKAEASTKSAAQIAAVDASLKTQIDAAQAGIAAASVEATKQIADVAADSAQLMVSKIANLTVTPDAARAAATKVLSHG